LPFYIYTPSSWRKRKKNLYRPPLALWEGAFFLLFWLLNFSPLSFSQNKKQELRQGAAAKLSVSKQDSNGFEGSIVYRLEVTGKESHRIAFMNGRKFIYYFQKGFIRSELEEKDSLSLLLGALLIHNDSGYVYRIIPRRAEIQFYKLSPESYKDGSSASFKPTGQKAWIAGYECSLWKGFANMRTTTGRALIQLWLCQAIPPIPQTQVPLATSDLFFIAPNFYGFPLKKKIIYQDVGLEITLTAEKVTKSSLPPSLFELPAHYKIVPFDSFQLVE
jgi:hypothetical protein